MSQLHLHLLGPPEVRLGAKLLTFPTRIEKARRLARETSLVGADFEAHMRDLYMQLGRAHELGGQHEQALAVYAELGRLAPKQS